MYYICPGFLDLAQPKSEFLKINFTNSRPQEKRKAQPGKEAAAPPEFSMGAFIGLRGQKRTLKNSNYAL
jgi:hypothetical protein